MKSQTQFKPLLLQLGEKIRLRRVIKNIPTKQIAGELSISSAAFRNIEKGISDPSFTTLILLAKILDMRWRDLVDDL